MEVIATPQGSSLHLTDDPPENSCRPAVDVLFRSVAQAYKQHVLGVILTGMGQDGKRGCEALRKFNAEVFAQDEASSVVWGMPGAVVEANLADAVYSLDLIGPAIVKRVLSSRLGSNRFSATPSPVAAH